MTRMHHLDIEPMFAPDHAGAEQLAVGLIEHSNTIDPMIDPNPGPSVDVRDRATELQAALTQFGKISSGVGFRIASDIQQIRHGLESRYDDVDAIAGRMANAVPGRVNQAEIHLNRAFGGAAMAGSGMMNIKESERQAKESAACFKKVYMGKDEDTGGNGYPKRSVYKKVLQKQVRILDRPTKKR